MRLLLIEDDDELRTLVSKNLERGGFAVDAVGRLADAREHALAARYDAIILDRRLPDGEGAEWLAWLRRRDRSTPVLVLTARDAVSDRVAALDVGADDYLVKPFALEELLARLRALLRRPGAALGRVLEVGDLAFDTATRSVAASGTPVVVPRRELSVLEALMRRPGTVVTRSSLEDAAYALDEPVEPNALDAVLSRLRRRLVETGTSAEIHTVRGVGYLIKEAKRP